MATTMTEERKMTLLGSFTEVLEMQGFEELASHIDDCYYEFWYDMEPDQIWKEQSELISEDYDLPEDLYIFASPQPDWEFADMRLSRYTQTW